MVLHRQQNPVFFSFPALFFVCCLFVFSFSTITTLSLVPLSTTIGPLMKREVWVGVYIQRKKTRVTFCSNRYYFYYVLITVDNLADNLHFNLTYPDFTQQTSLHVIHQQDASYQGLPTTYSTFSLLPSSIPSPHLHQPTVDLTKETSRNDQHLPQNPAQQPQQKQQQQQQQSQQQQQQQQQQQPQPHQQHSLPSHEGIPLNNILSPTSSPPKKAASTRTRVTRPPNAFLLFNKEMRKRLKIDNPTWTVSDISKEIGDRWRTLSQVSRNRR
jgi:hypothetical protein